MRNAQRMLFRWRRAGYRRLMGLHSLPRLLSLSNSIKAPEDWEHGTCAGYWSQGNTSALGEVESHPCSAWNWMEASTAGPSIPKLATRHALFRSPCTLTLRFLLRSSSAFAPPTSQSSVSNRTKRARSSSRAVSSSHRLRSIEGLRERQGEGQLALESQLAFSGANAILWSKKCMDHARRMDHARE